MRVLQVTAALEQGGVERGTLEMARFIVTQGVISFVASQGGRLVAELERDGSCHLRLPLAQRNPSTIVYSAFRLARFIHREGIDLVHARSRAPAWASLMACRMTGRPLVTTFHGTHRLQNCLKKYYNSSMVSGERVIAISHFIKQHIMDNYRVSERRIDVAPRGFDPARFNPGLVKAENLKQLKEDLEIAQGIPIISLPGRLTRWKGQELFLKALEKVQELQWQALIIGGAGKKAAYLSELKQLARQLNIADRVVFLGDQPDLAPYYVLSDLIVSASTEPEAFGRVAVESQAMGTPVIASAHGGSLETVRDGETGWLFRPGDSDDLAIKLQKALLNVDNLAYVGHQGRRWVMDHFTMEQMCRREWSTYQRVLRGDLL